MPKNVANPPDLIYGRAHGAKVERAGGATMNAGRKDEFPDALRMNAPEAQR